MAGFGDVLRGLGSVLNPQVAQQVSEEQRQEKAQESQLQKSLGMLALQKQMEQQSPEYQAKVEALKNEKAFREAVSGAGGDVAKIAGAAVQYGKPELALSLHKQQEDRAARVQQAKDTLDMKEMQLRQTHELAMQRITDSQEKRAADERFKTMQLEIAKERNVLTGEIARGNQQLKAMQFQMNADKELVTRTQKLQGALEKANLPEADAVLGAVEDALKTSPKVAEYLSGPKSVLPDMMVPDDVKSARQAFQKLFNITLKTRSGAAVTNQELERLKQEFATGAFKTEKQIRDAVSQARNIINKHYASVAAGFGKDSLDAYNENIRGFGGRVVLQSDSKADDPLGLR